MKAIFCVAVILIFLVGCASGLQNVDNLDTVISSDNVDISLTNSITPNLDLKYTQTAIVSYGGVEYDVGFVGLDAGNVCNDYSSAMIELAVEARGVQETFRLIDSSPDSRNFFEVRTDEGVYKASLGEVFITGVSSIPIMLNLEFRSEDLSDVFVRSMSIGQDDSEIVVGDSKFSLISYIVDYCSSYVQDPEHKVTISVNGERSVLSIGEPVLVEGLPIQILDIRIPGFKPGVDWDESYVHTQVLAYVGTSS